MHITPEGVNQIGSLQMPKKQKIIVHHLCLKQIQGSCTLAYCSGSIVERHNAFQRNMCTISEPLIKKLLMKS